MLQAKLGRRQGCAAFDVQAVCSGFVYALAIADRMVASGMARNALVVGAEIYSRILDWNDRGTCVLFGDGAGAVVLAPSTEPGILAPHLHADGRYRRHPVRARATLRTARSAGTPFVHDGRQRRVQVCRQGAGRSRRTRRLRRAASQLDDIDWLIPHQANVRIIDATAKKAGRAASRSDRDRRPPCQYVRRFDSARARRSGARRAHHARASASMLLGVGGGFTWGSVFLA